MVTYDKESGRVVRCLFCSIVAGTSSGHRLYMDDVCCAFLPRGSDADIHVLVVPKRHIKNAGDLHPSDVPLVRHMQQVGITLAARLAETKPPATWPDNAAIAASLGPVRDGSLCPVSVPLAAREAELAVAAATCDDCSKAWSATLHPSAAAGASARALTSPKTIEITTAFHAPPFNSIDHLHMHALVPPFGGLLGWHGAVTHNTMTPWSPSADALCAELEARAVSESASRDARL